IVGNFQDTVQIFGQQLISSGALGDAFLAKYDAQGNYQWLKRSISTSTNYAIPRSVSVWENDVFLGGSSVTGTTFGSYTVNNPLGGSGTPFIAKYDNSGNIKWLRNAHSSSSCVGYGVAANNKGDVFFTG